MRVFDGQVHLFELAGLAFASLLGYAIGYSLPLLAAIFLVFWPLFLLQIMAEGLFWGLFAGIRALWRRAGLSEPKPEPEPVTPRHGIARFIWYVPLVALTVGYIVQYTVTGTWLL